MDGNDGKLRFFSLEHGYMDGWEGHYILAVSPQDAAARYIRRQKSLPYYQSEHYTGSTIKARIFETEFDEFGILRNVGAGAFNEIPVLEIEVPY